MLYQIGRLPLFMIMFNIIKLVIIVHTVIMQGRSPIRELCPGLNPGDKILAA
jgi:hypothetical protein